MRISLNIWRHLRRNAFNYTLSSFDDARKFSVRYCGILLGDVAEFREWPGEWYAAYDYGDADSSRWFGGFTSRREASMFLLGAKFQRDCGAVATVRGVISSMESVYKGQLS